MTDTEILGKAIRKAIKNGYKIQQRDTNKDMTEFVVANFDEFIENLFDIPSVNTIIFAHDFAKAFFGEKDMWKETKCDCGGVDFHLGGFDMHHEGCSRPKANRGYKFHLQQMVLEVNPIKYLEKFL